MGAGESGSLQDFHFVAALVLLFGVRELEGRKRVELGTCKYDRSRDCFLGVSWRGGKGRNRDMANTTAHVFAVCIFFVFLWVF